MARFGRVALIGRSNVGKSTFLNTAVDLPLAIVSPLPQTTRTPLLGLVNRGDDQIAFVDTPGIHPPKSELGRRMNAAAMEVMRTVDARLFVTDITTLRERSRHSKSRGAGKLHVLHPNESALITPLQDSVPTLLVINKIDLLSNKQLLLPAMAEWQAIYPFHTILPISSFNKDDVSRVLDAVTALLPERAPEYAPDELTDRPTRYFVAEYVREQVLLHTHREVPHAVAVSVDACDESEKSITLAVTLHVEKEGQRRILIGQGGRLIGSVGTQARKKIAELTHKHVQLHLFVRVSPRWKSVERQLSELGYPAMQTDSADVRGTPKASK